MTVSFALQSHVDYLAAAGCTPVLLPLLPGTEQLVERLDGLLIPGGPDVDPSLYGEKPHPSTRVINPAADSAELELIGTAFDAGLPVLAICRGMQLLNVHCGGTLHQHLPEIIGHDRHRLSTTDRHRVRPDSLIAGVFADDVPEAACRHHQAIDRLGTGLTATAWAPDEVVEAVEAAGHPFAVGVQWEAGQTADDRLHRALADAARGGRTHRRRIPCHHE